MIMQPLLGYKAAAATGYRYFKFKILDNNGSASNTILSDLQIFVGATKYPLSPLTSNTTPSPYVADGVNLILPTYPAWRAFTGVLASSGARFSGKTGEVTIDMGVSISPTAIQVCSLTSGTSGIFALKSFVFYGAALSNFSDQVALITRTSETGWYAGEDRTYFPP